jgi:hypothetical protein
MTIPVDVNVPVPKATPTNWTKKLTNKVHADANAISGSVSATIWAHSGLDHIGLES